MSRNILRTSKPSSNDWYISWVFDKSWLRQEFPGLKPDWCREIRPFSIKKPTSSVNNNRSRRLFMAVYHFSCEQVLCYTFSSQMEMLNLIDKSLNMNSKSLYIESPHIFNMRMLILSWPWALFELRFWIIFNMSAFRNFTTDKRLSIRKWRGGRSLLSLLIKEYCFAKKELKILAFS